MPDFTPVPEDFVVFDLKGEEYAVGIALATDPRVPMHLTGKDVRAVACVVIDGLRRYREIQSASGSGDTAAPEEAPDGE